MKQYTELTDGWFVTSRAPLGPLSSDEVAAYSSGKGAGPEGWLGAVMPAQAHEILRSAGLIEDPYLPGKAQECQWVAERDWVYRTKFARPAGAGEVRLSALGLDTLVDVYLNGERIAEHRDMYLPLKTAISGRLKSENDLLLHFQSPHAWLKQHPLPEAWKGRMVPFKMLRKSTMDFASFIGAAPCFTPVGVYDTVRLEAADEVEIAHADIDVSINDGLDAGRVAVRAALAGRKGSAVVVAWIDDAQGRRVAVAERSVEIPVGKQCVVNLGLDVGHPALWWPRGYGAQPLYTVGVAIRDGGGERDRLTWTTGFRSVRMEGPLAFTVNGRQVKLWGANMTPMSGCGHRWNREQAVDLLDLAENANMVTLRAWGPGAPYHDHFYDEADRRGILIWQEFFHDWGLYPDDADYRALCRAEAEHEVRRLKHRPSILLWCGGNEFYMGAELEQIRGPLTGREIFEKDYPEICARLDPGRYYHPSSPSGGAFANDARAGDSHSMNHRYFLPGDAYPVLFVENTRIGSPAPRSLRRYLTADELWPPGFVPGVRQPGGFPVPATWKRLMTLGEAFIAERLPPVEEFCDPVSAEDLAYSLSAAHGQYLRRCVERYRRGRPGTEQGGARRTMGHYIWKFNDTFPMLFSSVVDSCSEPYIAYYSLKRAYEPVLVCFEIADGIHIWVVNDTACDLRGMVEFELFDMQRNEFRSRIEVPVAVAAGDSAVACDLDALGMIERRLALVARLRDPEGKVIARSVDFLWPERRLHYPEARLTLAAENGSLVVTADKYARCVELEGEPGGDTFGWRFEDNYFDLLPGEKKTVRLFGRRRHGTIRAKAHFSPEWEETRI
jgi:hypothetical protein